MANVPARDLPDSIEGLVRLAASGDEAAFARIVRLHHEDMARVGFVACGDADVAASAVAASWPVAWRRLGKLREPARLRAWLCAIAADEACRRIADRRSNGATGTAPGAAGETAVPSAATSPGVAEPAADPELAGALADLAPVDRARVALRLLAGGDDPLPAPIRGRLGSPGTTPDEAGLARRLRAYASIPVRPVDADAAARDARAEALTARDHRVSVLAAGFVAVLVVAVLYYLTIEGGSTGFLPTPSPTHEAPSSVRLAAPVDALPSARGSRLALSLPGCSDSIGKTPGGCGPWRSMSL